MTISVMFLVFRVSINQFIEEISDAVNAKRSKHIKILVKGRYFIYIIIVIWKTMVEQIRNSTKHSTIEYKRKKDE
jgi:hypothetical protein